MATNPESHAEQVPLKSDTDKPASDESPTHKDAANGAGETGDEQQKTTPETKPRGASLTRFFKRTKKDAAVGDEAGGDAAPKIESAAGDDKPPAHKWQPPKWLQRKPKPTGENPASEDCVMTIGVDVVHRDEKQLHDAIALNFDDILAEPDATHSADCTWRAAHRVFSCSRGAVYKLLSLVLFLPLALFWGLVFALLAAFQVWACVPAARALAVPGFWIAKAWNFIVRTIFDPCFRSMGLCCASMHLRHKTCGTDCQPPAKTHEV